MIDYKIIHHNLQMEFDEHRTNTHLANQLAIACMEINDYKEAFRLFKMNAEINPNIESLTNLAYFYFHEGEPDVIRGIWINREEESIKLLDQVLLLIPKTAVPSDLLGEICFATRKWEKAKEALEISLKINPTFENQYNLGSVLYQLGRIEEASKYYLKAHQMRNENYTYFALYYYIACQIKLGLLPKQEITELELARDDVYTEVDKDRLADLYYESKQYFKVVEAYRETKLWYSPDWVLPYFYALVQCHQLQIADEVKNYALLQITERIKDCDEDEDQEFTVEDRQRCKNEIEADKQAYLHGFENILTTNYRPNITFTPYIETKCYLFGCYRHVNPNFTE